jgi:hypothetical protein
LQFNAHSFYSISTILNAIISSSQAIIQAGTVFTPGHEELEAPENITEYLTETLPSVRKLCQEVNLPLALLAIDRLVEVSQKPNVKLSEIYTWALDASTRVQDELSLKLFLYIPVERAPYYKEPLTVWAGVPERFGCSFDIEEAGKCFATGRFTASVFHLMKVTESAVIELQMFLSTTDRKAHFGSVVTRLEDLLQKTKFDQVPESLKPYLSFLKDLLPQLHAVKDSWRNKVAHVDSLIVPVDTFTEEMAAGVYAATLLLMKKLAAGLPVRDVAE